MSEDMKKENPPQVTNDKVKPASEMEEKDLKQVTGGAVDSYLKIEGVPGESTDGKHKDWIEIL